MKRHLKACWWWPNVDCWLDSFEKFRGSGPVLLRNSIFLWFFRGVRTPCPLLWIRAWDWTMYTLIEIYRNPILSCALAFVRHFAYFLSHAQIFKLTKHSFLIPFRSGLDPNRFCKCKKREKDRATGTSTSFSASTVQQVEREMCSFWISSFCLKLNSL